MVTSSGSDLSRSSNWIVPFLLLVALLGGGGFIFGFAMPYLIFDSDVMERFGGREAWILSHVAGGVVALLVGPFVLWMGLKRSKMKVHRKLGMLYILCIVVSSFASFYLSITTEVNWVFGFGLFGLGCCLGNHHRTRSS